MTTSIKSPRKLIEVALPLDAINVAAAREKSIRHGHPSTMHLWWARRPLAAARAVIFAQMVNDPGYQQGSGFKYGRNKKEAAIERKRLFKIIEDLVLWENTSNEEVLERARAEIRRSWREVCELNKDHPQAAELFNSEKLPALHDPFAGGGSIPLEAQRLGLEAYATDLNPVAVLINKASIEIPPKFAGQPPIGPMVKDEKGSKLNLNSVWPKASGIAEDVRRYGAWMREEAEKKIGYIYPTIEITKKLAEDRPDLKALVGQKLTAIAWLWTRAIKCPNPGCGANTPMLGSFWLSEKPEQKCYTNPEIDHKNKSVRFSIATKGEPRLRNSDRTGASCLFCETFFEKDQVRNQATKYGITEIPLAIVVEGPKGQIYLPGDSAPIPNLKRPDVEFLEKPMTNDRRWFSPPLYGMPNFSDIFTVRQLVALTTFCNLVTSARDKVLKDCISCGMVNDGIGLDEGGNGATAYADAIATYLGLAVGRCANYWSSLTPWGGNFIVQTFGRQAIPMVWDHAEGNPFSDSTGNWSGALEWIQRVIENAFPASRKSFAAQSDAQTQTTSLNKVVSTDPPYYDNIGYADLSDFFYIWLRHALKPIYPSLFATLNVPKAEELVASPHRHGGAKKAEAFFLDGMTKAISRLPTQAHSAFPVTIYYAFKQSETNSKSETSSTGWETFLEALIRAGFSITGTWPMRTERDQGLKTGTNALASCIILVCRKRNAEATTVSRREYLRELNCVLPEALDEMTKGSGDERSPVAPVDLSQAIIGPGMAVFSKYSAVLEADGSSMSVRTALQLINRFIGEDDFDADTRFCLHWFEQHGWTEGVFGDAETLSRGKGTSVDGMKEAGVLKSGGGKVRLLKWSEYPTDWDPRTDKRTPIWEALHQLIRAFRQGGDSASGALLAALGGKAEAVRQLAYRLYTLCERLGQAEDARAYNELITSWTGIESAAATAPKPAEQELPGFQR